ncbi:MAG: hypothetical protein ACI9N1_002269 [Flavobacteriales bacterium]|jgi:hypothetical protein
MKFKAPQYARGISQLELIYSEGFDEALWSNLQSQFIDVSFDFNLSPRLPLGKQAEKYVSQMIKNSSRYELILENHQVIEGKRTVGELDFIILDTFSNTHIHLELATKFYLKKEDEWVGPNLKDRLDLKIGKYHSHQQSIIENAIVKSTLKELNIEHVKSHLLIIGQLYERKEGEEITLADLNQAWIPYAIFSQQKFLENMMFNIPTKKDWVIEMKENNIWYSKEDVMMGLTEAVNIRRSQMIWMSDKAGSYSRFFVTWW